MTVEVNIPEAKDLSFKKLQPRNPDDVPVLRCHFCGKETIPDTNWMYTVFAPIKDLPDVAVMFFVCSDACAELLCSHPQSHQYLFIAVHEMMKYLGYRLTASAN